MIPHVTTMIQRLTVIPPGVRVRVGERQFERLAERSGVKQRRVLFSLIAQNKLPLTSLSPALISTAQ